MFIETLEFTIPVDLCDLFSTLKRGPRSNLEFPASVNSYGTTQDASVQVVLRSNKLTFKVDGVSSDASIISKSESKTLKLSVFDVDRTLMPQENDNYNSNNMTISEMHHSTPVLNQFKRHHEVSVSQPPAKSIRTSYSESPRPRSPVHRRSQPHISPRQSPNIQSKSQQNDTPVNVKLEPEDPDLIEIEPDDIVPKKETPYMQIDYSSDVPHTQTSQAALDRLSHPQSSHSQSPGSSSSSFHQNVPHVPDFAEPSTSQARYGDQSADDFLVFQDENDDGDDNEADYSNDGPGEPFTDAFLGDTIELRRFPSFRSISTKCHACDICGSTYSSRSNLRQHVRFKHEARTRYCCNVCNKKFLHKHHHMAHMNSHANIKPFQCHMCHKEFLYESSFKVHFRTWHSEHCQEFSGVVDGDRT
ncbi:zinc finger E-box-binding homeobox 1-like isoform X2 [Haliotis rufescens]|uniref:zinc finger E-box-binding homeobox 1-like isoform X2 n=1 Tax=Haliotis rufescens TaxID=6454 RepID=UPI00201ED706|nr:zinc finger E-box-binding homeobox 1-like isoform X2 [Haliotis rufescens]